MATRNLLHQSKLGDFTEWLVLDGWKIHPSKGLYEVLRAKKHDRLLIVYRKADAKEHYSVMDKDCGVVRAFLRSMRYDND